MFSRLLVMLVAVTGTMTLAVLADDPPQEAPTSFELVTNGFTTQTEFDANLTDFTQIAVESGDDEAGLGPTYNGTSCVNCHRNPQIGGGMSRFELRCGRLDPITGAFIAPVGGTLVRQLAVSPECQQRVPDGFFVTKRRSTSLFGLGYIEVIRDNDILAVRDAQDPAIRGVATTVKATANINDDGTLVQVDKIGRFGWKCQQATLIDFSADALINEIGRTNGIFKEDAPALDGRKLTRFKKTTDPEDPPSPDRRAGHDTVSYARFMRTLQAPTTDFATEVSDDAKAGGRLFTMIGCAVCHVPTWTTAPVGVAPAGLPPVEAARGNKIIHPFSDFLLHDIGTGETEVVQGGGPETRKMLRTALLWANRTVTEMGHDGRWATLEDAIQGHDVQAAPVRARYRVLTANEQRQLKVYVLSR